ncbi:hypothetical protein PC129_g18870 [Phytophthora cactorum]|uniref:Uncharacterized protein n=1 Tax=Phytophthora cactorum TaxID=29920 RepID=A0A8T1HCG9_9STRA|nr:hypothetical protein Pcac1_g23980 [Phytophthora cactorum]KAG2806142.1 hypothetical protein PC112_g17965 [Phytophthora cactorum]KAG2807650.1 hypothetical protein PC111_g16834 [Phytophthora cactorum]KAG2846674.1 hypothetical protein PC113_g17925 [Phytophthora cactorum]KAG2885725.1 hypothetical protein PC114_g19563 [Phytophthora cactorum]
MLFDDMLNAVHVDEKIFYVTEPKRRFLLLPDEHAPTRKMCRKRFITRVMFLAAVGRPRYDKEKQQVFDGKVGIWAFVKRVAAQRSSSRRPAGTIITKEVSVNKTKYRYMLTSKLLPALHERWPTNDHSTRQRSRTNRSGGPGVPRRRCSMRACDSPQVPATKQPRSQRA